MTYLGKAMRFLLKVFANRPETPKAEDAHVAPSLPEVLDQIAANMVAVEGGEFLMGAGPDDAEELNNKRSQTHVRVDGFQISRYPLTQAQWAAVTGSNPSYFNGCDNCPVETVSWNDVQEFIHALNLQTSRTYRLPTEAEWEYAARGGNLSKGSTYAGSNELNEVGWYHANSGDKTHPVGQMQPNELGLYDMTGNVYEWCLDWYGEYPFTAQTNPQGPGEGTYRLLRGGSWGSDAKLCRVWDRRSTHPGKRSAYSGFRLVLPPP